MPPSRLLASGILVLGALVVFAAIGLLALWLPPSSGYRGTIYFADHYGVWKMRFPELEPVRLVSQDLFDPRSLTLSPNRQWLTYWTDDYSDPQDPGNAQWVLSTQGGTPQRANRLLGQGGNWMGQHQLLYKDCEGAIGPHRKTTPYHFQRCILQRKETSMTADDVFWNRVRGGLMMLVALNQKASAPSPELHTALMIIVRAIETRHPTLVPPTVPGKLPARRVAARRMAIRSDERSDRRDRPAGAKSS